MKNAWKGSLNLQVKGKSITLSSYSNGSDEGTANGDKQCVELIRSYESALGFTSTASLISGAETARNFAQQSGGTFRYVHAGTTSGLSQLPAVGAVISVSGFQVSGQPSVADPFGHVGIVQSITKTNNGSYEVTLFDQNYPETHGKWKTLTITSDPINGKWSGTMSNDSPTYGEEILRVDGWSNPD